MPSITHGSLKFFRFALLFSRFLPALTDGRFRSRVFLRLLPHIQWAANNYKFGKNGKTERMAEKWQLVLIEIGSRTNQRFERRRMFTKKVLLFTLAFVWVVWVSHPFTPRVSRLFWFCLRSSAVAGLNVFILMSVKDQHHAFLSRSCLHNIALPNDCRNLKMKR